MTMTFCPFCEHKLYKYHDGFVCKNWNCKLYFKLGLGWVYLDGSKKNSLTFFVEKYEFDITRFENKKEWLRLKSKVLSKKGKKCEVCEGTIPPIHIHHILPRTEYPNLTFDEENLMVLCEQCHKKIHSEDKYAYR